MGKGDAMGKKGMIRAGGMALAVLLGEPSLAQQALQPALIPARFTQSIRNIEVMPDGSWKATVHMELKLLQAQAIARLGQPVLRYSELNEQLDVTNAYTLKADGTKIPVAPDAIITQQSPGVGSNQFLSDEKQKVILFPNLEVGDTVVYDTVATIKPRLAGNFMFDTFMPTVLTMDKAEVTVSIPKAMAPQLDSVHLDIDKKTDGDRVVYSLHYSNTNPVAQANLQSEFDLSPRFSISTFKDYDVLAAAYGALIDSTFKVTPEIQAKADEITAGVSDHRLEAQKLYDWIGAHVRYIALEFGQGGIVPHDAAHTLGVGYGDCKDQAVLFIALLKAKGIDAYPVLINSTNSFTAPKVASFAVFNHLIVWLPEFKLYADTTTGKLAPFGVIPHAENGKPALVVGLKSGALRTMPLTDAATSSAAYKLSIVADEDNHITSNSSISAGGEFGMAVRALGQLMQGQDGSRLAANILQKSGTPHASGTLSAPPVDADAVSYGLSGAYSTPGAINGLARNNSMPMFDNLRIVNPFSEIFFGPLIEGKNRDVEQVPCYNGHVVDDETLQFPATRHLSKLPEDQKMSRSYATYTEHWVQEGSSVSVHRELVTRFDHALCSGTAKDDLLAIGDRIRLDQRTLLTAEGIAPAAGSATTPQEAVKP